MATLCPRPKNLPEVNGLTVLLEEISRQPSIDRVLWLLVVSLTQIYSREEQAGQRETQRGQLEERKNARKCNIGAKSCAQGDKNCKKRQLKMENRARHTQGRSQLSVQLKRQNERKP